MLKVRRTTLDGAPRRELEQRQEAVDAGTAGADPWGDFTKYEIEEEALGRATVRAALEAMFSGKCAYCESEHGDVIDHVWPKAPHKSLNARRGSPARMFVWRNLVWACEKCNGFSCKGAHMKWDAGGRMLFLDPTATGDDPLCYFMIEHDETSELGLGWVEIRSGLTKEARARAEYTRRRLQLNKRKPIRNGRARAIRRFLDWVALFHNAGRDADFAPRDGRSFRSIFKEILDPSEPYLAGVRQILREDAALRAELLEPMPELGPLLDAWDLPPDDCATLRAPPAVIRRGATGARPR